MEIKNRNSIDRRNKNKTIAARNKERIIKYEIGQEDERNLT